MKKNVLIIFVLINLSCSSHYKQESLYITKCGRKTYNIPNLILINNEKSYINTLIAHSKPVVCKLDIKEFEKLKIEFRKNKIKTSINKEGFQIIHYIDNKINEEYFYESGTQIDSLINIISENIESQNKNIIIDWINGIRSLYNI